MKKVAWFSGLPISQHHFQLQDKFVEQNLQLVTKMTSNYIFGLKKIELDESRLENGVISVIKCEAIMPDGTLIKVPDIDAEELNIQVDESMSGSIVYLAVPPLPNNAKYVVEDKFEATDKRYHIEEYKAYDAITGSEDVIELQGLKLNIYLVVDTKNYQDFELLPIAKIKSVSNNKTVTIDRNYIPPILSISANEYVVDLLKNIYILSQQRRKQLVTRISNIDEFGVAGIMELLFIQLLNRYIPILEHMYNNQQLSAEELYRVLASLSSEMRTYTHEDRGYSSIPAYKHENLTETFKILNDDLQESFLHVFEERAIKISLTYYDKYAIYVGDINNSELIDMREWSFVIACKSEIPKEQLSLTLPKIIKIASKSELSTVVSKQLPGIKISLMTSAPKQIPFMSEYVYFELDPKSSFWDSIFDSKIVSLYLTRKFAQIDIQLWAIKRK